LNEDNEDDFETISLDEHESGDSILDRADRDYDGSPLGEGTPNVSLRFTDRPRQVETPQVETPWEKKRPKADGVKLRGTSYSVVANVDPDLWRDKDFRQRTLIPADKRPGDKNVYCFKPSGEIYAAISFLGWKRNRRLGLLDERLAEFQASMDIYLESAAVTEGLIEFFGTQWGHYIRECDQGDSIPCAFANCEEKEKLGISGHGFKRNNGYIKMTELPDIPIQGMSKAQLEFHRSWSKLNERDRIALWVHFVPKASKRDKAIALGLTVDGYRFLIDDAIDRVRRLINA